MTNSKLWVGIDNAATAVFMCIAIYEVWHEAPAYGIFWVLCAILAQLPERKP